MQDIYLRANGIQFHLVEEGDKEKPLLLFLHGFPEYWYSWRHQIPVMAQNFYTVAPDLRGYNLTDKPTAGYDLNTLVDDIFALMKALEKETVTLVAHDWGGAIAWAFAYRYPQCLDKLVVLNCPHPARLAEELRGNPQQLLMSWYFFFFQLPWLPETLIRADDYAFIEKAFRAPQIRPGTFSYEDIVKYKQAIAQPGALTAAINYYRNALNLGQLDSLSDRYSGSKIKSPTMLIWGVEDFALSLALTRNMKRFFDGEFRLELIAECSHWTQQEAPEEVNKLLQEFLFQ
ncbi:MAG: alpha/beta hydrolase [Anaerolineae bacterium]|nr:alpha/beta hydrolase [Gloeobacterales cyanobacterium ES-bin-313]